MIEISYSVSFSFDLSLDGMTYTTPALIAKKRTKAKSFFPNWWSYSRCVNLYVSFMKA